MADYNVFEFLASQDITRLAAVNQEFVDGLNSQFHDWWGNRPQDSAEDMASSDWFDDDDRGPIGHWPNIENFFKDNYPAAHQGLDMGPQAEWKLEGHSTPYSTGPEAVSQYGYDPAEIVAGMLLLHNQSDPLRGDMSQQDQDRLNDIAQKRFMMQRNYENRTGPKGLVNANKIVYSPEEEELINTLSQRLRTQFPPRPNHDPQAMTDALQNYIQYHQENGLWDGEEGA